MGNFIIKEKRKNSVQATNSKTKAKTYVSKDSVQHDVKCCRLFRVSIDRVYTKETWSRKILLVQRSLTMFFFFHVL